MELENYAISVGQPYVLIDERLTAEHSTMQLLKYYKEINTICQLIYGVLEFLHLSF